jgi:hypothetical protein
MKRLVSLLLVPLLLTVSQTGRAQGKFMTKTGRVTFFSTSIIEDIEAINNSAAAVIDLDASKLAFSIPIKEFQFKRTLMQEHFNENYMESVKFPRASFAGHFLGLDASSLGSSGSHQVKVEGDLTVHGVTHHITVPGTLEMKDGKLQAFALFSVAPADYNIEIPLLVRENIAKIVSIRVILIGDPVSGTTAPAARSTSPN